MTSILIVGAGPTGLTLAATLARFGVRARVIDRMVEPADDRSRAVVIQPRTLELFEPLGIADEILARALHVEQVNLITPSGRRGIFRIRPEWIESRYDGIVTLPQDETERILLARLARDGIAVERGVELLSLAQDDAEVTTQLRYVAGDPHTEQTRFDWVIGCDGAHSAVRHATGLAFDGVTYPDECMLGDVDVAWAVPEGEISICPTRDGVLLAFPLHGAHRFRVIMIVPATAATPERVLPPDEFLARLTLLAPPGPDGQRVPPALLASRWITRYRLHRRGVPSYRAGRCLVAGDAAHVHSPVGGQGMNTGIQDAINLGWKLAMVVRGEVPAWVLDTYHDERHRVGEYLLSNTDRGFGAIAGGGWVGRLVRWIMPTIGVRLLAAPCVGRRLARFVSETGIRYPHSRLSSEGASASDLGRTSPRAGDRVPDVMLGGSDRLAIHLAAPAFTLLFFAGDSERRVEHFAALGGEVAARYGSRVQIALLTTIARPHRDVVLDVGGAAHRRLGASTDHGGMYLVRPDGYIAWRDAGDDAPLLWAALAERVVPLARG
jgi:2-polyprenyl-6-methoxyphenol hydroxylase-like FAD-dependent oxidoreductase